MTIRQWQEPTQDQLDNRPPAPPPPPPTKANRPRSWPKIICICGSTKFIEQMAITAWELETTGAITLSCHLLPSWYMPHAHHAAEALGIAEAMDELHKRKIDLADEIFVVNVGGYIGKSTRSEIVYALDLKKPVRFLEPITELAKQ